MLRARDSYLHMELLNLPGAARLRVPSEEAQGLREITRQVKASCSLLFTVPGMPSFNLWAGMPPPPRHLGCLLYWNGC